MDLWGSLFQIRAAARSLTPHLSAPWKETDWYSAVLRLQPGSGHPTPILSLRRESGLTLVIGSSCPSFPLLTPGRPGSHLLSRLPQSPYLHPPGSSLLLQAPLKQPLPPPVPTDALAMPGTVLGEEGRKGTPILARLGGNLLAQQVWGGGTQSLALCAGWATWSLAAGSQQGGGRAPVRAGATFTAVAWGRQARPSPVPSRGVPSESRGRQGPGRPPGHLGPLPSPPPVPRPRAPPVSPVSCLPLPPPASTRPPPPAASRHLRPPRPPRGRPLPCSPPPRQPFVSRRSISWVAERPRLRIPPRPASSEPGSAPPAVSPPLPPRRPGAP